ncbi:MAG: HAMP domain-containing protein [Spirochaetaceae bacterium]|nr:MAG: HAMP domain-containing protein [Spirochaetaceae bacterium]
MRHRRRTRSGITRFVLMLLALLASVGQTASAVEFFEQPRLIVPQNARFPVVESVNGELIVIYQEAVASSAGRGGEIHLRRMTSSDGREWTDLGRFGSSVRFSETEPNLFSAVVTPDKTIYVALAVEDTLTVIYRSTNAGQSFTRLTEIRTVTTSVAPQLSARNDNGLLLFVNQEREAQLNIQSAASDDGRTWSDFEPLRAERSLLLSFLPAHVSTPDGEFLVYQGLAAEGGSQFNLYAARSTDGGRSWSEAVRFTNFRNPGSAADPDGFDNQRPHLSTGERGVVVTWERRQGRESARVFSADLRTDLQADRIRQISSGLRSANSPRRFTFNGDELFTWFDEAAGQRRIILAEPFRTIFQERVIGQMPGNSTFPEPVVHNERLHLFWQNDQNGRRGLAYLEPDQRVDPPRLSGRNFAAGLRAPREVAEIQLAPPPDPSGIQGYAWVWSRDAEAPVPTDVATAGDTATLRLSTDEDGDWFLRARAHDRAGNWSEPATIRFVRDLTPPDPVVFEEPERDALGFLTSNTFTIEWQESDSPHIAGYSFTFVFLGPQTVSFDPDASLPEPPRRIMTTDTRVSRTNMDNGLWALRVSPVDDIGNFGEPQTLFLRLNRYVPVTIVNFVESEVDRLGRTLIEIRGRGFASEGRVERIILDRDGTEPYDYVFTPTGEERFTVRDDRSIIGPIIDTIASGRYRLGIVHPARGTYWTGPLLDLEATGTVKFGDFTVGYRPDYVLQTRGLTLSALALVSWLTSALLALTALLAVTRLASITREGVMLHRDVRALITGEHLVTDQKQKRMDRMRRRGLGLRVKFTLFFVTLVVAVVLMVAIPLGNFIIGTQQETLTQGLRGRTSILLDSIVSGSAQFLPNAENNLFELNTLSLQTNAVEEALFATITGIDGASMDEVVWASSDPRITRSTAVPDDERVIDTERLIRGESRYEDELTPEVERLSQLINDRAREALGDIPERIDRLNRERIDVAVAGGPGAEDRVGELDDTISVLISQQQEILNDVGNIVVSIPELSADTVLVADTTEYLFYKPIVYREMNEDVYFHGLVRILVSSERIIEEIQVSQRNLIMTTGIITLVAVGIGVIGALLLASIIVIPIRRLVDGVELIRDTEDKAQLENHVIRINSRDELATLAGVVNEMTQGLVKAAAANKDLTVGKEVQKMFIPLKTDQSGQKLTTAADETEDIEFFGYYEGAKGVSGDYFNYRRLDREHYAIIKCDVAGKGVPAALIMVEVATIYISYFRNWNVSQIAKLPELVESINDLLEERGFKGRFAAFTLAILNVKTGVARVCNAGDTLMYTYQSATQDMTSTTLPTVPAAGVFPSEMIPNGFPQVAHRLQVGDILMFFTDGMEEAKRILRDAEFQPTEYDAKAVARFSLTDNGDGSEASDESDDGADNRIGDEEFSIARIRAIVKAVQSKGSYVLERAFNPVPNERLVFDYSDVEPNAESTVLALIGIEKIFRLVPDPSAGVDDEISIDREVDDFLAKTFLSYSEYFHHRIESREEGQYRRYAYLREDDQYDDLTILSVRKK